MDILKKGDHQEKNKKMSTGTTTVTLQKPKSKISQHDLTL